MRSLVRRLLWLAAVVVLLLLAGKLLVTLPRFAERWLSDATGLHVTMRGAGVRLLARAVVMNDLRFALDEHGPPLLQLGELDWYVGQDLLVLTDPVVRVGSAEGAPAPRATAAGTAGRIAPGRLQVSGARIEGPERTHALPPVVMEHRGIDVTRTPAGWSIRSELAPDGGRVGVEAAWEQDGGALAFRLALDLEQVDVPLLGARGATGRLVYEHAPPPLGPRDRLRGDLSFADVSFATDRGEVTGHGVLNLQEMTVDLAARRFESARATLREGEALVRPELSGPLLPLPAGWTIAVADLQVEQFRVRAGRLPTLGVTRLAVRDVGTAPTWPVALTGRLPAGGIIEANGTLAPRTGSFTGSFEAKDLELGPWVNPFFPRLAVDAGRLDARLAFDGRPGLHGEGMFTLRDLRVNARPGRHAPPRPFLAAREAQVTAAALTLAPWDTRLSEIRLAAPVLSLHRDAEGWGLDELLSGQDDPHARSARETLLGLAGRLPALAPTQAAAHEPAADAVPPPARVEARDVVIELTDATTQPPLTVRLANGEVHAGIDAAPPFAWRRVRLQGRAQDAAPFELRVERDATRLAGHGRLGPGPLEPWNPILARTLGHVVRAGRARVGGSLEWANEIEATLGVMVEGVVAESTGGPHPVADLLGTPLGRLLALLADPTGPTEFAMRIEGDPDAPALGLPAAFETTLRRTLTDAIVVPLFDGAAMRTEDGVEYIRLAPLTFAPGESALGEATLDTLDRLATLLRWEPRWLLYVLGHDGADETQPSETVRLADERAAAVHHHLTKVRGIPAEQVEVEDPETGTPSVRLDLFPGG